MARSPAFGLVPFNDAVEMLGVSATTARRLLKDPATDFPKPTIVIGRKRFYRNEQQLLDWLDKKAASASV